MPIPTQAVWAVGEKTGWVLAAMAYCTAAVPARVAKSPSDSICRLLWDLLFLLGHAIIRFSGHAGTTADRAALCILIDQIPAKALYDIGDGSRRSRLIDVCWVGTSNNRDFNRLA